MPRRRTPKGYRYFRRAFLNREGWYLGAHILATVAESGNYARVNIADCDRVIRLEFDAEDTREMRNSLHKLDLLITTLIEVRNELTNGYIAHRTAEAERRRKRRQS
ncbi:MAG TPA: hypothetical protein VHV75_10195 [Solirubrobacteraceae bacterium]|jgi:hypothetical protein|nr:hypothetical protein [Solirubrobacteraceae bacterium]